MGLDAIELVMEVEETFGFSIPDEDAASLDTAGRLFDYIMSHRFQGRQQGCLSSVTFYRLRRALMAVCGIARDIIRPTSGLLTIIPENRRRIWLKLADATGLRLPDLKRPWSVTAVATVVFCLLVAVPAIWLIGRLGVGAAAMPILGIMFLAGYALALATRPWAVLPGKEFETVGGLAKAALQLNYGAISDDCDRVNADEVWETLRQVIVRQLAVSPEDVTKESNFVKDLGVG